MSAWVLFSRQDQQLGVGGEYLAHRVLKLASGAHPGGDAFDPLLGDALDAVLAAGHKGQRPSHVTGVVGVGAMTGRSATAAMGLGERAGQKVRRDREAAQEIELALADSRGLGALWIAVHL